MTRRFAAALLAALVAAPSFGAPVEAVRVEAAPTFFAAAPAIAAASLAPRLTALSLSAPSLSAPSAALSATPAPAFSAPSASFAAPTAVAASAYSARSSAGVAARVSAAVRSWGAPIEQIFGSHDVLLVGENHGSLESIETLTREMPRLARAGVTAVGIEGLKRPHQDAVDSYVSKKTVVVPTEALMFSPRRIEAFAALLSAAREHGVRVVALGVPLEQWSAQAAALAAKNTGLPARAFAGSTSRQLARAQAGYEPGYNEAVAEVYLTRRNESMAGFLSDALKGGGKAVVLVGQAHVDGLDLVPGRLMNAPGSWGTLAGELTKRALRAFSLTQTGGKFVDEDEEETDRLARPQSYRAAADASPSGAPAFIPLGADRGLYNAGVR